MTRTAVIAKPSARACRQHRTGARAYKPLIKVGKQTEVVAQGDYRGDQGETYTDRAEAVAVAQGLIDRRRADVLKRASGSARFAAKLQGEWEVWGGKGDIVEAAGHRPSAGAL